MSIGRAKNSKTFDLKYASAWRDDFDARGRDVNGDKEP